MSESTKTPGDKTLLSLIMTERCNLNCEYCLKQEDRNSLINRDNSLMSTDTARKSINLYWKMFHIGDKTISNSTIIFHGGEPLLNRKVITESVKYIRELDERDNIKTDITVNTNGTLIDQEFAKISKEYCLKIVVSLDGPKMIHDEHRKYLGGRDSFDEVLRGLNFLKEAGAETFISTVLTPSNFNSASDLLNIVKDLGIKEIIVNPLIGNTVNRIQKCEIKKYAQRSATAAFEYFTKAEKSGIKELQIFAKRESFSLGAPASANLDVGCYIKNQIVVWPDKSIGICEQMKDLTIGCIDSPISELIQKRINLVEILKQRLPSFNKECSDCNQKNICGGGCAFSAKDITGDLMRKDPLSCVHSKQLWNLLKKEEREK